MKSPTYTIAVHAAAYGLEWKVGRSLIEFKELSDRLQVGSRSRRVPLSLLAACVRMPACLHACLPACVG
eukprot:COSAG02_NODE_51153_length_316_cov_0.617512_1_plen_68_part_10